MLKQLFSFLRHANLPGIAFLILPLGGCFDQLEQNDASRELCDAKIAITQITSHDSLDQVYRGIVSTLNAAGIKEQNILSTNAQGDISTATQIAQKIVGENPDVVIAISTPSAQTCLSTTSNTGIPLLFATVTDPIQAGLVKQLKKPGGMVSGTRNIAPIREQLDLLQEILSETKTLGVILDYSEENSVSMIKALRAEAGKRGIKVITAAADNSSMVGMATRSLTKKADALFLLQDNTVASALPVLLQVAQEDGIPVMSTFVEAVEKGALFGLAYDEYAIGVQTGKMAVRILEGEAPGSIDIEDPVELKLAINLKIAKELNLKINHKTRKRADLVIN